MNRPQKIALGIILGVPVVCCLGGILTIRNKLADASGTLDGDLMALRAHGFPIAPEDLKPTKPIPAVRNAAPLFIRAAKTLNEGSAQTVAMKKVTAGMSTKATAAAKVEAEQSYSKLGELVTLAEQAADRPDCQFVRDWNQGFSMEFPEFRAMKDLCRLLAYKAERQNRAGDATGALRSIERAQRIGQHAEAEGFMIGALVAVACETIVNNSFCRIIDTHGRDAKFLAAARKVQAGFGPLPSMRRVMATELVFGRIGIQKLSSMRDITAMLGGQTDASTLDKFPLTALRGAFEARLVHEYRLLEPDLPKDPEQWEGAKKALAAMEKRVDAEESPLGMLNRIILPVSSQSAEAIGKLQAQRRITEASLRILQARVNGPLPKKLPSETGLFADPFGAGPLHYKPTAGGGFMIYSNGPDRQDDGGKVRSSSSKSFDIVAKFR